MTTTNDVCMHLLVCTVSCSRWDIALRCWGGRFSAFVVSQDQRRGFVHGYASESGEHSHYWVELDGSIIDLGTYYLPAGAGFLACEMPAVFWDTAYAFPKGLTYAPEASYASSEVAQLAPHIIEKMEPFLAACHARMGRPLVKPKNWEVARDLAFIHPEGRSQRRSMGTRCDSV